VLTRYEHQDHALQMLTLEGSPAGDYAGQNMPATPPAHWADATLANRPPTAFAARRVTSSAYSPRHDLAVIVRRTSASQLRSKSPLQSAVSERTSSPVIAKPATPSSVLLAQYIGARQMHPSAALFCARTRPRSHPMPSVAIPPSNENAVQMLGEPFVLKSSRSLLHPPQCLPSGSLAQTRVLAPSTSLKTVIVGPKTPKNPQNPRFTQTRVLSGSSNSRTVTVFRLSRPAQTEVLDPSTGCSESSTNRTPALSPEQRVRGLRGFGHWDAEECGRFWQRRRPEKHGPLDLQPERCCGRPTAARIP